MLLMLTRLAPPAPPRSRAAKAGTALELLIAVAIGVLTAAGVYLLLRERTFSVLLGLTLLSYAVNLFVLRDRPAHGRYAAHHSAGAEHYADPLAQALVLTAIVISFAMTAFVVVLAVAASPARRRRRQPRQRGAGPLSLAMNANYMIIAPVLLPAFAAAVLACSAPYPGGSAGGFAARLALPCWLWRSSCSPDADRGGYRSMLSATGGRLSASCWCSTASAP